MRTKWSAMLALIFVGCAASRSAPPGEALSNPQLKDLQRSIAGVSKQVESIRNDVMILQDQMETTRIQVQKLSHHQMKKDPKVKTSNRVKKPMAKPQRAKNNVQSDKHPLNLYRQAYALYEAGKLNQALEKFERFVQRYPQHDYADNAIYWMGETYYDQKEFILAITEFRRVIKRYPTSNKMADAILKIGYSYQRLDDANEAKKHYQRVVEQYPYTPAAKKAVERLARLDPRS